MRSIKTLLVSSLMLGMSLGSQAADYSLGNISNSSSTFGGNVVTGSFLDKIYFSLDTASDASFGAGALNFTVGGTPFLNVNDLSLNLVDASNNSLQGSGLDFTINPLASGSYYLQVSGIANGLGGGLYAGGISVSAVPEPGFMISLVAGLGVIGFMAYRRRETY